MNLILNPGQTNTQKGVITLPAAVNLTGCENLLWKIVNNNGASGFALAARMTAGDLFVGASGDLAGNTVAAEPLDINDQCQVLLDGACHPGDLLALSTLNWGRLAVPAAGYGTGYYTFMAEQAGQPGQLLLVRRINDRAFTL